MSADPQLARLRRALAPPSDPPTPLAGPRPEAPPRPAAVLVLLYPVDGQPRFVLERRPVDLPDHAGQISLPGGGVRADDGSFLGAAQRETYEELGVAPDEYVVWGRLEPVAIQVSNFVVVPFVAYAPRRPAFQPDPREVAEVLEIPLAALVDPRARAEEIWQVRGSARRVAFYRHGEHKIWGATARVLVQISRVLRDLPDPEGALDPGEVLPWPQDS